MKVVATEMGIWDNTLRKAGVYFEVPDDTDMNLVTWFKLAKGAPKPAPAKAQKQLTRKDLLEEVPEMVSGNTRTSDESVI